MNEFDVAYQRCMLALGKDYVEGTFSRIFKSSKILDEMLRFEASLEKLWDKDYVVFRAVLVSYFRFMKGVLNG